MKINVPIILIHIPLCVICFHLGFEKSNLLVPLSAFLIYSKGLSMAQAVNHRPVNAEGRVRALFSLYGIYGGQSGSEKAFSSNFSFPPVSVIPQWLFDYDGETISQNCCHQRPCYSCPSDMWALRAMVMIMSAGDNSWLVHQSSLPVLPAEISGASRNRRRSENFAYQ
jgi:hypothetical protein